MLCDAYIDLFSDSVIDFPNIPFHVLSKFSSFVFVTFVRLFVMCNTIYIYSITSTKTLNEKI